MATCRLCQKAEATKKNSHILPHFLIKTAISKGGSNQRDYELTFSFSENEFVDTFFGRSITMDTIEEYKGKELTEEEIKKENPFAKDFLLCPSCETNIGVLEDYFAQEVHQRLQKANFKKIVTDKKGNRIVTINAEFDLILLFVLSIFFRCSVSGYHGFNLNGFERKFRKVLLKYLDDSIEKIKERIKSDPSRIPDFSLITTFFESPVAADPTKNFVTILHTEKPFFVYLNEITFQLFVKGKDVTKIKDYFFGITDMVSPKEAATTGKDDFKVTILNKAQLKKILTTVFESAANRQLKFFQKAFREVHKAIFSSLPSDDLVRYFIQLLLTQEAPPGERYSREYFALAMFKACKIWYQIP